MKIQILYIFCKLKHVAIDSDINWNNQQIYGEIISHSS